MLVVNLTYSALAGVAVLVFGLLGLTRVVKLLARRRDVINAVCDERVNLTQEVLQGVRFVKYFAWERAFHRRLTAIRAREIRAVQMLLALRSAIGACSMAMPIFVNLFAFVTYSLTGHRLDAAVIFSSLALFNSLRTPLNWLPVAICQVIDGWASVKRIQAFLLAEETQDLAIWDASIAPAIQLVDATFTWEKTLPVDREIVGPGSLTTRAAGSSSGSERRSRSRSMQTRRSPTTGRTGPSSNCTVSPCPSAVAS